IRRGRCKDTRFPAVCQARAWASGRPIRLGSSRPGRACWEFNASDTTIKRRTTTGEANRQFIDPSIDRETSRRRQPVARDRTRFHLEDYGSPGRTGCRRSDIVGPVLDPEPGINQPDESGEFRVPHF
ncbi:hypothetical protein ALC56_12711, partial [Trachymyrmex septentrionalis]